MEGKRATLVSIWGSTCLRVSDSLLLGSRSYASHCFEYPTLFRLLFVDRNTSAANCRSTTNYRKLGSSFLTFSFHYFANGSGSGWSHFLQFICHGQLANISKATLAKAWFTRKEEFPRWSAARPLPFPPTRIFSHTCKIPSSFQSQTQSKTPPPLKAKLLIPPLTFCMEFLPMLHFALFPRKEAANAEKVQSWWVFNVCSRRQKGKNEILTCSET